MKHYIRVFPVFFLAAIIFSSCATKKRKGDVSGFTKFYHNTTAKYNGYFNAGEIMKETYASLEVNHIDDYTEILPVYNYNNAAAAKAAEGQLDVVIEKVTTVATIHEVSNYVDDCYVMMGEAQYLKQDFESAEETLEYFQEEFNPNDPSSRNYKKKQLSSDDKRKIREEERKEDQKKKEDERKQKEDERKEAQKQKEQERKDKENERERIKKEREQKKKDRENASRKRGRRTTTQKDTTTQTKTTPAPAPSSTTTTPPEPKVVRVSQEEEISKPTKPQDVQIENTAYHLGMLWLARTYIERERYTSAEFLLRRMWDDPTVKNDVKKEIPAAQAHLAIKQKKYTDAKPYLMLATEMSDRKKDRARYAYILAQLREIDGDYTGASEAYQQAKKLGSNYEMKLNAELNLIKNSVLSRNTVYREAEDKLLSIRKQNKNEEYRDRITLILAEMAMASGDQPKAKKYLKEALTFETGNNIIKAQSYYTIAGMEYEDENYVVAKNYYDSTLTVMPSTDPRYSESQKLSLNLREIARNLEIIEIQDSLLRLGSLPKDQQIEIAKKILEEQQQSPGIKKQVESPLNEVKYSRRRSLVKSSFFAYDPIAVEKGKKDFQDRWGDRTLQDNWRRSAALRTSFGEEESDEVATVSEDEGIDNEALEAILETFPATESDRAKVNSRIEIALFDLGKLYRDKLENYTKSAEVHEELLKRFPDTQSKLETYYYLYLSYIDLNNISSTNTYKEKILSEFPDTKYALAISDPNYMNDVMAEQKRLTDYYDQAFAEFENKNYRRVEAMITESESRFGTDHELRPKFALLGAMTTGNLDGEEEYIAALQDVITRYPNTPEQTRAREVLRFLKGDESAFESVGIEEVDDIFEEENGKLHYMAVVVYNADEDVFNETKISISNYNKDKHRLKKLQLADIGLNKSENSKIILIRKFKGKDKAMEYYNDITKDNSRFVNVKGVNYEVYPVTQRNYRKIIDQKSANKYRIWFERKYLKTD